MTAGSGRVLGVDGCPNGWVGVVPDADRTRVYTARTLAELLDRVAADGSVAAVGVDIPIGLADRGPRAADLAARVALGARRSSIFLTPVRAAVEADDYAAAQQAHRAGTGQGLSRQAYGLAAKIREVDGWVRTAGLPVLEVHPELSFASTPGGPLQHGKKTWGGAVERRRRLASEGIVLDGDLGPDPGRAGVDDVLDAAAAAWTMRRWAVGAAHPLPDPPELMPDGIAAAIWV